MNRKELQTEIEKMADGEIRRLREAFEKDGELRFARLILFSNNPDDGLSLTYMLLDMPEHGVEKDLYALFIKAKAQEVNACAALFVSECWTAVEKHGDKRLPKDRPDRQEVIYALLESHEAVKISSMQIRRPKNGPPTFFVMPFRILEEARGRFSHFLPPKMEPSDAG